MANEKELTTSLERTNKELGKYTDKISKAAGVSTSFAGSVIKVTAAFGTLSTIVRKNAEQVKIIERSYYDVVKTFNLSSAGLDKFKSSIDAVSRATANYSKQQLTEMRSSLELSATRFILGEKAADKFFRTLVTKFPQGAEEIKKSVDVILKDFPGLDKVLIKGGMSVDTYTALVSKYGVEAASNFKRASEANTNSLNSMIENATPFTNTMNRIGNSVKNTFLKMMEPIRGLAGALGMGTESAVLVGSAVAVFSAIKIFTGGLLGSAKSVYNSLGMVIPTSATKAAIALDRLALSAGVASGANIGGRGRGKGGLPTFYGPGGKGRMKSAGAKTGWMGRTLGKVGKFGLPLAIAGSIVGDVIEGAGYDKEGKAKGGFGSKAARVGGSALGYAGMGAAIGSFIPGIGTALGAGIGAAYGLFKGVSKEAKIADDIRKSTKKTEEEIAMEYKLQSEAMDNQLNIARGMIGVVKLQRDFAVHNLTSMANAVRIGKEGVAAATTQQNIAERASKFTRERYDRAVAEYNAAARAGKSNQELYEKSVAVSEAQAKWQNAVASTQDSINSKLDMAVTAQDNMLEKLSLSKEQLQLTQSFWEAMRANPAEITAALVGQVRVGKQMVEQYKQIYEINMKLAQTAKTDQEREAAGRRAVDAQIKMKQAANDVANAVNYQRRIWDEMFSELAINAPEGSFFTTGGVSGFAGMGPAFTPMAGPREAGGYWTRERMTKELFPEYVSGRTGFEQEMGRLQGTVTLINQDQAYIDLKQGTNDFNREVSRGR